LEFGRFLTSNSYKTYNNRFRDWSFPADRYEREQVVRKLYALVASSDPSRPTRASTATPTRLPVRLLQPQPPPQAVIPTQQQPSPTQNASPRPLQDDRQNRNVQDRISVSTANTWGSGYSSFDDDTFSSHRASIATTNSSTSAGSQYSGPTPVFRPLKPPKHDHQAGLWNDLLRVIACGKDHSKLIWHQPFTSCQGCGFSQWHSLMVHARSIAIADFVAGMNSLRYIVQVDFAGNFPIHYLMSAGVGIEYFAQLLEWCNSTAQNTFGQNPLHALNPQDLVGEQLISFLDFFKAREQTQGLLFTQRDNGCRTPLHTLLQQPLERHMYRRILRILPHAVHQLQSFDNKGRNTLKIMNKASLKIKEESLSDYVKIQAGIIEVQLFVEDALRNRRNSNPKHPFHDIARGARGPSYHGFYFECRFCNLRNAHSNSYLEQMICACSEQRDRNAPDERGMTPAHALVVLSRCNNDPENTPESASQTAELFKVLIPADAPLVSPGNSFSFAKHFHEQCTNSISHLN
jgi:hypothetical protein